MLKTLGKLLAVALLGLSGAAAAFAAAPEGIYVFHVEAAGCKAPPDRRAQPGFRLRGQRGIVTALHGVVGCSQITARRAEGESQAIRGLTVELVDIEHDAALLRSPAFRDDAGLEQHLHRGQPAALWDGRRLVGTAWSHGFPRDLSLERNDDR